MANKKRLDTIIEGELRDLLTPGKRDALDTESRIKILTVAVKWAAVKAKISESEEGSEFTGDDSAD